jgi:enoyl-CoA hydratase/carnithine racemase
MTSETRSNGCFTWSVSDRVGTLRFARPERKNALTFEGYEALRDLFRSLRHDGEVRAVVMTGAGGNFCSGGDVEEIIGPLANSAMDGRFAEILDFARKTSDVVAAMRSCPQPIVAAVDGVCVGAGAALAMASDLRLGTQRARVAFLFVRVGLCGADMGACNLLPRIVGAGRAAELLYTGRFLEGQEGERWGFFNRLEEPAGLEAAASKIACDLASGPTVAHAVTKASLHREWSMSIDDALSAEAEAQAMCMMTRDFRRAYTAFSNREKPIFAGD